MRASVGANGLLAGAADRLQTLFLVLYFAPNLLGWSFYLRAAYVIHGQRDREKGQTRRP
jgi:hypothetical protein